jgi:hypothetical protein
MKDKRAKFNQLPTDTRANLQARIEKEFGELASSKKSITDWNNFTDILFGELFEIFPNIFEDKKDLSVIKIWILAGGSKGVKNICCGDPFDSESLEVYFSLIVHGNFNGVDFSNTTFYGDIRISGAFNEANFYKTKFVSNAWFGRAKLSKVYFIETKFVSNACFADSSFDSTAIFTNTFFNQKADFSSATFASGADFSKIRFGENGSLDLSRAMFAGISTRFTKENSDGLLCEGLHRFNSNQTIFETPVVFDLNFKHCPDFSECYFLKKFFIKENWPSILDSKIKSEDEEKFRFLKTYFAQTGDHFNEQKYFSYEMKAVEQRKKQEIEKNKENKKTNFLTKFINKKYWELWLFKLYKIHSDYGMSVSKPLKGLISFFAIFGTTFFIFFPNQVTPKDVTTIEKFGFSLANSFIGTLFPLANLKILSNSSSAGMIFIRPLAKHHQPFQLR